MRGLINASLNNPHAVFVMCLALAVLGSLTLTMIPIDILPVFKSPAVQVLTFYGGMDPSSMEHDITIRMERWTGQANGMKKQESRSILGASIVRNYFQEDQDLSGALTMVNSLALATLPNLPPGTLPPVVLPFDPTSTTPVCLVALNSSKEKNYNESILYDVARYEVRNLIMQNPGASAPVVIGGKLRSVMLYLDQDQMQARGLDPVQIMNAVQNYNLFFPSGDVRIGKIDYALSSTSMYDWVERMADIPIGEATGGKAQFLRDVAIPRDSALIQTNIVRVDGRRQVYIPIYRQVGASTLAVVNAVKESAPDMEGKLTRPGINLQVVMDQSIYVKASIMALVQEGLIGSILCSLVILMFLGQWRMTFIAILTLPISVLSSLIFLHYTGQTINVMTLAGLTLAIGPMIDSAIICLENTHRYLSMGASPREAALHGAGEVAMPELVSTLCTFLVLSPLALMPGTGRFLYLPMTLAVMFAMTTAYLLSRTLVPSFSSLLLSHHQPPAAGERHSWIKESFLKWESLIDQGIVLYSRALDMVLRNRIKTVVIAFSLLAVTLLLMWPIMHKDFFPDVDSGAFEIAVRAPSGTRVEETEKIVAQVEEFIKDKIKEMGPEDLKLVVSEIGLIADWSSAYTPNSGTHDAIVKVQLESEREHSSQEYIRVLRKGFQEDKRFQLLDFSFDAGGLVRGALNEGKSTPINIQITGNNQKALYKVAELIREDVKDIDGIVDARIQQRLDAPELVIETNRAKAAQLGLTQADIMKSVIGATNSSIAFNKKIFWIDPVSHNQYFVGVQYPESKLRSTTDVLNIPITGENQKEPIPLSNVASIREELIPTEVHHVNIQPAIDLTMGVEGRDLGHVAVEVSDHVYKFGNLKPGKTRAWTVFDPRFSPTDSRYQFMVEDTGKWKGLRVAVWTERGVTMKAPVVKDREGNEQIEFEGSDIVLSGEYSRMQGTFRNLGVGLILASLLIYFLMVGLDRSFIVPLAVMMIVPLCLCGILPVLYVTGSAVNVQSLLGFIFIVGIKVANTVLMTDFAQEMRRHEGLTPLEAIRKAAVLRVRPVTMTALAAFFAMIPTALALERGSEANAPLARAILGGLLAGEPATLFVLPALYVTLVRDKKTPDGEHSQPVSPEPQPH
jgi:multidrug efflux pump subunit AcrB